MPKSSFNSHARGFAGEKSLRRVLGTKCFYDSGDHVGRFWGLLETRPYMRVLQNLAKYYFTEGHFRRAA